MAVINFRSSDLTNMRIGSDGKRSYIHTEHLTEFEAKCFSCDYDLQDVSDYKLSEDFDKYESIALAIIVTCPKCSAKNDVFLK